MSYPRIRYISVENFMAFPSATVEFDLDNPTESGVRGDAILNIKGFNDSGKSAILIAAAVCLLNAYERDQKKFIRDGENKFTVKVGFEDGCILTRCKYADGKSYYELTRSNEVVYTTREGNALTSVSGIPAEIQAYLGVIPELNFRRRTDPLLLTMTSGSDNFAMLNTVLRTQELANAAGKASKNANALSAEISDLQSKLSYISESMESIWETPERVEALVVLNDSIQAHTSIVDLAKSICFDYDNLPHSLPSVSTIDDTVYTLADSLLSVRVPSEWPSLDEVPLDAYDVSSTILQTFWDTPRSLPTLNEPDTASYVLSGSILDTFSSIPSPVPDVPLIEDTPHLDGLFESFDNISRLTDILTNIDSEHSALVEEARSLGIDFASCDNCGSLVPC